MFLLGGGDGDATWRQMEERDGNRGMKEQKMEKGVVWWLSRNHYQEPSAWYHLVPSAYDLVSLALRAY